MSNQHSQMSSMSKSSSTAILVTSYTATYATSEAVFVSDIAWIGCSVPAAKRFAFIASN